MNKLAVHLQRSPGDSVAVGQVAEADRRVYFEYDASFLSRGLQLSPFKLPLQAGLIDHRDRAFGPLPGMLDDSLPDGWGLLLMDRLFRQRGLPPTAVSPLQRLSYLGTRTMGALTYHPNEDAPQEDQLLNLHQLGNNAQAIHAGHAGEVLPALIRAGGSPGGARPKVLVGLHADQVLSGEVDLPAPFAHWMVKFPAGSDPPQAGAIEYAYSLMASVAGVGMPPTRLIRVSARQSYFAIKRFDRAAGNKRLHVHTFGNLVHVNFRIPSTDYMDLLKITSILTRSHADVLEAFRRMVFNVAAHNRDDHAKNFAFIMNDAGEWSSLPAYDLTFSQGTGGEHMMTVAGEGANPTREHLLKVATDSGIERREAQEAIEQVNKAIKGWPRFAREADCRTKARLLVAGSLKVI